MKKRKRLLLLMMATVQVFGNSFAQNKNSQVKREKIEWLNVWMPHIHESGLPRVLLIGNSITQLYYPLVDKALKGKALVDRITTSKSLGDSILIEEVALIMKQYPYDIIHFNNGMHGWDYTEQEWSAALPKFYETIRKYAPKAKLIWASTTPVRDPGNGYALAPRTDRVKDRNRLAADFFSDKPVLREDLFGVVAANPAYYEGGDGVHPNEHGTAALAAEVVKNIERMINEK